MPRIRVPLAAGAALLALALPGRRRRRQHLLLAALRHRRAALQRLHRPDRHPGQPHRGRARGADRPHEGRGRQQPGRHLPDRRRRPDLARRPGRPAAAGAFARCSTRASPRTCAIPTAHWFGFSQRARIIFYAKDRVPDPPQTYDALADPEWKGRICIRSALSSYNLSLMAAMIANEGEDKARAWATGLLANLARPPEGADTDQLKGLVSGECDIAVVNTYYFARALAEPVDGRQRRHRQHRLGLPQPGHHRHPRQHLRRRRRRARPAPGRRDRLPGIPELALGAGLLRQPELRVPGRRRRRRSAPSPPRSAASAATR